MISEVYAEVSGTLSPQIQVFRFPILGCVCSARVSPNPAFRLPSSESWEEMQLPGHHPRTHRIRISGGGACISFEHPKVTLTHTKVWELGTLHQRSTSALRTCSVSICVSSWIARSLKHMPSPICHSQQPAWGACGALRVVLPLTV